MLNGSPRLCRRWSFGSCSMDCYWCGLSAVDGSDDGWVPPSPSYSPLSHERWDRIFTSPVDYLLPDRRGFRRAVLVPPLHQDHASPLSPPDDVVARWLSLPSHPLEHPSPLPPPPPLEPFEYEPPIAVSVTVVRHPIFDLLDVIDSDAETEPDEELVRLEALKQEAKQRAKKRRRETKAMKAAGGAGKTKVRGSRRRSG